MYFLNTQNFETHMVRFKLFQHICAYKSLRTIITLYVLPAYPAYEMVIIIYILLYAHIISVKVNIENARNKRDAN